jgi:hypothetical protein
MIIGIDPGKEGGIAVINNGILVIKKMPSTPKEIFDTLKVFKMLSKGDIYCYLEKVQGLPKMSGAGMFTFGQGFGWLQMALLSLEIPTEQVTPQKWQKEFQLGTKGEQTTSVWKNKMKNKAEQLYPKNKMFLWGSDAVLIAEYGRRNKK